MVEVTTIRLRRHRRSPSPVGLAADANVAVMMALDVATAVSATIAVAVVATVVVPTIAIATVVAAPMVTVVLAVAVALVLLGVSDCRGAEAGDNQAGGCEHVDQFHGKLSRPNIGSVVQYASALASGLNRSVVAGTSGLGRHRTSTSRTDALAPLENCRKLETLNRVSLARFKSFGAEPVRGKLKFDVAQQLWMSRRQLVLAAPGGGGEADRHQLFGAMFNYRPMTA